MFVKMKPSIAFTGASNAIITLCDAANTQLANFNGVSVTTATSSSFGGYSVVQGNNTGLLPDQEAPSDIKLGINIDKLSTIDGLMSGSVDIWLWYTIGL